MSESKNLPLNVDGEGFSQKSNNFVKLLGTIFFTLIFHKIDTLFNPAVF